MAVGLGSTIEEIIKKINSGGDVTAAGNNTFTGNNAFKGAVNIGSTELKSNATSSVLVVLPSKSGNLALKSDITEAINTAITTALNTAV